MEKTPKFKKVPVDVPASSLTPLDVTCGSTKCEEDFHCYSKKKSSIKNQGKKGVCKECGDDNVDWRRIYKNDIKDADFIFSSMRRELIRQVFFQTPIDEIAVAKAVELGRVGVEERARRLLKQRIGKFTAWDGRQVPMGKGDIVNYAQHATATCCRACLEAWHNIPADQELSAQQLDFCTKLVMRYVGEKMPDLNNEPIVTNTKAKKNVQVD